MDEVSLNTEPTGDDDDDEFEIKGDCAMTDFINQIGIIQGENLLPAAGGMEFDFYEDVYYFYNCYVKQQGFGVRVSNTWYRKSKERYRGKLSYSSAERIGGGTKRALQLDIAKEVQKIRLFRTVIIDSEGNGNVDVDEGEYGNRVYYSNQLKLKEGDDQAVQNYFSRLQLMDPNFFYVADLNEKGCLRNLF
ncbi:unnamed protein product [Prunus armeniaca]